VAKRQDWFRRRTWTAEDRADFESRLSRSRTVFHKSQYLRIQALHLVQDAEPPLHEAALELLDRLVREFPDRSQLGEAHRQRGNCLVSLRRSDEALGAFQAALAMEQAHPGVRGPAYLDFSELVLALGRVDLYPEALEVIKARQQEEILPVAQYRAFGAAALFSDDLGNLDDARAFATRALSAAALTESPFRYHRRLGLVDTPDEDVQRRLWQLARSV
jgi:tetratricopeptide (TPR) repeat protein